jgi:peptidyl-prolyl cis-trans isomerase SurA
MRSWIRSASSAALPLLLLAIAPAAAESADPSGKLLERIVAVVNGQPILLSELEEAKGLFAAAMKRQAKPDAEREGPAFEKNVLEQLVRERLVAQEIDRRGLTANEAAIDRAVEGVMAQNGFGSIDDLQRALRIEGMSLEEYRVNVKKQMETSRLLNSVIRPKIQVTEGDVDASLKRSGEGSSGEWRMDVAMILKAKPKATWKSVDRLRRQIEAGIPFEKVAARESEGPAASEGGKIGWVSPSDLQPELARALETMKPGEVSGVIETKQGFYLLRVAARERGKSEKLSLSREKIREELEKTELDRNFDAFVRGLREKALVEIKL